MNLKKPWTFLYNFYKSERYSQDTELRIWDSNIKITKNLLYKSVFLFDGKIWQIFEVKDNMLGFKFCQFIFTKKRALYNKGISLKNQKKKSN